MKFARITLALLLLPAGFALAQEQGLYPGITYDSDILGNVNLATGTLAIQHQLLHLPEEKGFQLGDFYLTYNDVTWTLQMYCDPNEPTGDSCTAQWMPTFELLSSVPAGAYYPGDSGSGLQIWNAPLPYWWGTLAYNAAGNPSLWEVHVQTGDGSIHSMVPTGGIYRSVDGSDLVLTQNTTELIDANGTQYKVSPPNGFIVPPSINTSYSTGENSGSFLMTATNIHGQSVTSASLTDSIGRVYSQAQSDSSGCSGPLPTSSAMITSVSLNGATRPLWKQCVAQVQIQTAFDLCHGYNPCDDTETWEMLQSIVYTADGTTWSTDNAWTFLYGRTDSSSANYVNYGLLTGIITPQGGGITYGRGTSGVQGALPGPLAVTSRTLDPGDGSAAAITTYTYQNLTNAAGTYNYGPTALVTNPDLTSTLHEFDFLSLAEYATIFNDKYGNPVESVSTAYLTSPGAYLDDPAWAANNYVTSQTVTWPNGISCMTQKTYPNSFSYTITYQQSPVYTYTNSATNGEVGSTSTYDCSTGTPSLLNVVETQWLDLQDSTYANENLIGLPQQVTETDGSGNKVFQTTYGYDQNGESSAVGDQTRESQWLNTGGSVTTSTYFDANGQATKVVDPSLNNTLLSYDPTDLVITGATAPAVPSGATLSASLTLDPMTYMMTDQTVVSGASSSQRYDDMFRTVSGTSLSGAIISITYFPKTASQLPYISKTNQIDAVGNTSTTQTVTDGFGRTIQTNQQTSQGTGSSLQTGWTQQDTCYDNMGRVAFQSYPYVTWATNPAPHSCNGTGERLSYDPLGRLLKTLHQDLSSSTVAYTGRATQTTDEMGVSRITQVDGMGRPTIVCELSATPSMPNSDLPANCGTDIAGTGFVTTYGYNLASHTITVTQGVQQRTFQTDTVGRMVMQSEPESGITTYSYSYNTDGLSVVRTRPQANQTNPNAYTTTTTQLDSIGRVASIVYVDSTQSLAGLTHSRYFLYDTLSSSIGGSATPLGLSNGQLVQVSNGISAEQFGGYDALGDVGSTVQLLPGWFCFPANYVMQFYKYDLRGLQTQVQYSTQGLNSSLVSVSTGRNIDGSISYVSGGQQNTSSLTDPNGHPILLLNQSSGPFGMLSGKFGNNAQLTRSYDQLGRQTSGSYTWSGGSYSYSGLAWTGSYLTASTDSVQGGGTYTYDKFGRLASANLNSQNPVLSFTYDRYGNRWSQTATGGAGSYPQPQLSFPNPNTNNQITTNTYDAAGNVMSDNLHSYTYDAEGNLIGVDGLTQNIYDAMNQRIAVINESGVETLYGINADGTRATSWSSSGTLLTANYYADGAPIAYYNSNSGGNIIYELADWEGTIRARVDQNFSNQTFTSLPFGDGSNIPSGDSDPLHFAELDYDSYSGTDHAEFRQYSSTQGRWLTADHFGGSYDLSNPQSFNRYAYVLNNPLGSNDPSGLAGCDEAPPLGSAGTCYNEDSTVGQNPGNYNRDALKWLAALGSLLRSIFRSCDNCGPPGNMNWQRVGAVPMPATPKAAQQKPAPIVNGYNYTAGIRLVPTYDGPGTQFADRDVSYKIVNADGSAYTGPTLWVNERLDQQVAGAVQLPDGQWSTASPKSEPNQWNDGLGVGIGQSSATIHQTFTVATAPGLHPGISSLIQVRYGGNDYRSLTLHLGADHVVTINGLTKLPIQP